MNVCEIGVILDDRGKYSIELEQMTLMEMNPIEPNVSLAFRVISIPLMLRSTACLGDDPLCFDSKSIAMRLSEGNPLEKLRFVKTSRQALG